METSSKEPICNAEAAGNVGSIPGLGSSPGGGHGNPLQYSCLGNLMNRRALWATVHGVAKSWTQLSDCHIFLVFPDSSVGKESACNVGDPSLIPGSGRSAGEGIG